MKSFLTCLLTLTFFQNLLYAQEHFHLLEELNKVISESGTYDARKQDQIRSIHLSAPSGSPQQSFNRYHQLFEAYKVYKYDSAYFYARKQFDIARSLRNDTLINMARINVSFSLLSAGMYKETQETLDSVDIRTLNNEARSRYYSLLGRFYYDLGDFDKDVNYTPDYTRRGNAFMDSTIALTPANSFNHVYYQGLKDIKSGNNERARTLFRILLGLDSLTDHQVAVTASTLSDIYIQRNMDDSAIALLIQSAIADIKSSTRETSAIFNLAALLYKKGDVKNAYTCIQRAIADATFYGARQRKVQVSAILPLIEGERVNIAEKQKNKLIAYAAVVTLLLLAVIGLMIALMKQIRKVKLAQQALMEAHTRLQDANEKLMESNTIKEEYIGYFFNYNSDFFSRIERFKRSLDQKIMERKLEEVKFLVNNINLKREKEDLLKSFDKVFLTLFPGFVDGFNALFKPEDQIHLKDNELLNTDLRIFALIRMGISDNEKIAHILEYSVNTIYTYKTRIKNKSLLPNEDFEQAIMNIK
jgi:tetratricopeptide (TPR) repeat protein